MPSSLADWIQYVLATRLTTADGWARRLTGQRSVDRPPLEWAPTGPDSPDSRRLIYRGPLRGNRLRLHYGFDGWQGTPRELPMERAPDGSHGAEVPEAAAHLALDCAITDGDRWDNNREANYRLWLTVAPFDAHLHVDGRGGGPLGLASLQVALRSAGMSGGLASWPANHRVARAIARSPRLKGLVWVRPGVTPVGLVRRYLRSGFVGLKLHPTVDNYPADTPLLDPYLEIATRQRVPVAIHSAPGTADPDAIRRLADRFPEVPILLYHTYLGPVEGRRRAVGHVRAHPRLYLETSWCVVGQVLQFVHDVGPDRVLFGSDASVDGPAHYCRQPPNVEGQETYNDGLLRLAGALEPAAARLVLGENARSLFRLT